MLKYFVWFYNFVVYLDIVVEVDGKCFELCVCCVDEEEKV